MNWANEYERSLKAARQEAPPPIDVSASVRATVSAMRVRTNGSTGREPAIAALVAAIAALMTVIPSLQSFWALTHPMTALVETLRGAL